MISKTRLAAIEEAVLHEGAGALVNSTVLELVAEVRRLQEQMGYQQQLIQDQNALAKQHKEELAAALKQLEQAKQERLGAEVVARLVDEAYWRRVEYAAVLRWAKWEYKAKSDLAVLIREAREIVDELDRQRHAEG